MTDMTKVVEENLGIIQWWANRLWKAEVEELVQETCLGVLKCKTFDPNLASGTWFRYQVLAARTRLMRQRRQGALNADKMPEESCGPGQEDALYLKELEGRSQDFSAVDQQVFRSLVLGSTTTEIGKELGFTKQAASQAAKRVRLRLTA